MSTKGAQEIQFKRRNLIQALIFKLISLRIEFLILIVKLNTYVYR